jgi:TRAP-type mannitol/chloroaromatic compound transport system permease small subunit
MAVLQHRAADVSPEVLMQRFLLLVDHVSIFVGKLFGWSIVLLTGVVCYEVFMRYVIGEPTTWAYDFGYILYGTLFIMAGAYALATHSHVRADVLTRFASVRTQAAIEFVLYLLFFFPAVLAMAYFGSEFAEMAYRVGERSPFSPAGPILWPFKALIPLSGAFLTLQGIAETIRAGIAFRTGRWPDRGHDVREIGEDILEEVLPGGAK